MTQIFKYQRLTLWWALLIFILCSAPFGNIEGSHHLFFPGFDKLVHCGLFFVFAILSSSGFIQKFGTHYFTLVAGIKIFAVTIIYGGIIELLQKYVFTWRDGGWDDLFADSVGTGMAIFSILVILYASANAKD